MLNVDAEYKLSGIIEVPSSNIYNIIIFNHVGLTINKTFSPNKIYFHNGLYNDGNIVENTENKDLKEIGIIIIYYKGQLHYNSIKYMIY